MEGGREERKGRVEGVYLCIAMRHNVLLDRWRI